MQYNPFLPGQAIGNWSSASGQIIAASCSHTSWSLTRGLGTKEGRRQKNVKEHIFILEHPVLQHVSAGADDEMRPGTWTGATRRERVRLEAVKVELLEVVVEVVEEVDALPRSRSGTSWTEDNTSRDSTGINDVLR